jgi:hypothetical protein
MLDELAASKPALLMLMGVSFASGALAVLLSLFVMGSTQMLTIAIPGFVVGAFFAIKYATFDRSKKKQEEHKRNRNRHRH